MINGLKFRDMIVSAGGNIEREKQSLNALNVFPVPDGDTGTNMAMTMSAAIGELSALRGEVSVGEVAGKAASALLRGARGNSGVILSLIYRGIAKSLKGKDEIDGGDLADAFASGVKTAYSAVMKPTEGTILTVSREAADAAVAFAAHCEDPVLVLEKLIEQAKATLERTPEILPVLKQAGVVDAGGKGFVAMLQGAYTALKDGVIIKAPEQAGGKEDNSALFEEFDMDSIKFMYCTEFLVNKPKTGPLEDGAARKFRAFLESVGDSIVFVDDTDIIKIHVHTNHPGEVLETALSYGLLSSMKIENMKEQYAKILQDRAEETGSAADAVPAAETPADPLRDYGFVAVSSGEGLQHVFADLGVDVVVKGGQTMNPSTEDILDAVMQTPALNVFVFPNNKNIIMAAQAARDLCEEKNVLVIPTRTIPQGMSALLAFDESEAPEDNESAMLDAIAAVQTGMVTFAVRDSVYDGIEIKQGEMMAMKDGKLAFTAASAAEAGFGLIERLAPPASEFLTVIFGADVEAKARENMRAQILEKYADKMEITFVDGDQPIYSYILAVE